MASLVLGGIGAAIGSTLGPGGAWKGFQIGAALGQLYEGLTNRPDFGSPLSDLKVQGASPGVFIPIVFGEFALAGSVVWAPDLHEVDGSSGSKAKGVPSTPTRTLDAAVLVCKGEITRFNKIWADSELVYDYNGGTPTWAEYIDSAAVTFYTGTFAQTADPLISAERVAAGDEPPAYLGRAYTVFESFPWSRFGHTPQFKFEVVRGSYDLEQILTELFVDELGLDAGDVDFSALAGIAVDGFAVTELKQMTASIEGLLLAMNADIIEIDGQLVGVLKVQSPTFAISEDWMGVSLDGQAEIKLTRTANSFLELPKAVVTRYFSQANDYQQYTQRAVRDTISHQNEETLDLPMILSDNRARQISETRLYERHKGASPFTVSLAPREFKWAPGDVGTISYRGKTRTVRIISQRLNLLGNLEWTVADYDSAIYTQTVSGADPGNGASVSSPGQLYCNVVDLNALNDGDADWPTIYAVMSRAGGVWPGGEVTVYPDDINDSHDRPQVYPWTNVPMRAVMGTCDTVLPDGAYGVWDEASTVDVTLIRGELITRSSSAVLRGMNLCVIGDEILQFRTATLLGTLQYRLSGLIRGRRGTEWAIPDHVADEAFFLVDDAVESFFPAFSQLGRELDFTGRVIGVDVLRPEGTAAAVTETVEGKARKPYSPCMVAGSRDGGLNLTITWQRRARKSGVPSLWSVPLDETSEAYEVDILDGVTVVRTISVTSETAAYSAAQQVTDFGSAQSSLDIVVCQVSPVIGRGFGRAATV